MGGGTRNTSHLLLQWRTDIRTEPNPRIFFQEQCAHDICRSHFNL